MMKKCDDSCSAITPPLVSHSSYFALTFYVREWFAPPVLHVKSMGWGVHNSGHDWKHGGWQKKIHLKGSLTCSICEREYGFVLCLQRVFVCTNVLVCLRVCICVCVCTGACGETKRAGAEGVTRQLGLLPLEMICILLIRAWVALRLPEHGAGVWGGVREAESQHPSDITSSFTQQCLPLSLWGLMMSLPVEWSSLNRHQKRPSS